MKNQRKLVTTIICSTIVAFSFFGCQKDDPQQPSAVAKTETVMSTMANSAASMNGRAGAMPAYYDGKLFTVNMREVAASEPLIAHNKSINEIYASNDLDEEQDFIPVLDAIQGDGFNPLWVQFLIVFNPGFTPHQFFSDTEVEAATEGSNPEITLVNTGEVYRCAVIGPK